MSCTLELQNLSTKIGENLLFENVNLKLTHKEKIAIIGANGIGKSTLLEIIAGLKAPNSGQIKLFDKVVTSLGEYENLRPQIGFLLQNSDEQFLCPSVFDDVAFSLNAQNDKNANEKTEKILKEFGIFHLKDKVPFHLSGGEKKLVALAGVLVTSPRILLLDEPTAGLDEHMQLKLCARLKSLDISTIIVSHDKNFIQDVAKNSFVLSKNGLSVI